MTDWASVEDLARLILDLDETADSDAVEEALFNLFEINFDVFQVIVDKLAKYTIPAQAALTGTLYQGFVHDGSFIYKVRVENDEK